MSFCTVKCPLCGSWMSRTLTKRSKPFLYCGSCGFGMMLLRKSAAEALDRVCENITEKDLPPETLKKQREKG